MTVTRTETLDRTAEDLVQGKFLLASPASLVEVVEFICHCENNVRRPVEGKDGVPINRWERTGHNYYFHALNYLRLAVEEGQKRAVLNQEFAVPPMILGATPRRSGGYSFLWGGSGSRCVPDPPSPPHSARDSRWFDN